MIKMCKQYLLASLETVSWYTRFDQLFLSKVVHLGVHFLSVLRGVFSSM